MTGSPQNRIAWAGAWSREHNNSRYEELLPRLSNVDRFYVDLHPWWPIRGLRRRIQLPLLSMWLGIRYPLILSTDWRSIASIRNRVVLDHDDPLFSDAEIRALNAANLAAVVVTSESVKKRLSESGVRNPVHVIPQGVAIRPADEKRLRAIRAAWRKSAGEIIAGIHQPRFDFSEELPAGAQQMYAVDALLALVERARKKVPQMVLWLIGEPSAKVKEYAGRNPWVRLLGYQRRSEIMEYVSAFDIGLYPRTLDLKGRASIKVLEYMACGVPVVGFNVEEMSPALDSKSGIAAVDAGDFGAQLVALAKAPGRRSQMGARGKRAAGAFGWEALAGKYFSLLNDCLSRSESR